MILFQSPRFTPWALYICTIEIKDMETTEYRLSTLESVLAEFIMQQNRNLTRMERSIIDLKEEMSEFKTEMSEFKEESRQNRRDMDKKWGEVTNKLGTFAEDFVAPNIPRIAREQFGFPGIDFFMPRVDRRNPQDKSQNFEFDTLVINDEVKKVILTEAKFTVRMDYLKGMLKVIENFRISFPEYADYELITIFASMSIQKDQVNYLTSKNIYAMALGEENMELLNYEELSQRK